MSRYLTRIILLALLWLTGCASTPGSAPVRDASYSNKPYPVAPAGFYRIQRGDTLFKIAFEFGLDYHDLASWNELPDPGFIRGGDLLRLTPPKPAVTTAQVPRKPVVMAREIKPDTRLPPERLPPERSAVVVDEDAIPDTWNWPSNGPLLTRFGERLSKGIDIGGQRGLAVQAAASGKVVYAGSGLRGYGKLIIIRHGKTLLSAYAHNARILVFEGRNVVRGQTIAEMGDTDADRIKLHFEIREYGKPVDPLIYLPKQS